jgi:hypothetical protein
MQRRNRLSIQISIAATSACLIALAGDARAQSAAAQARFDDGVRLMKSGKVAEACEAFETSNRIESRAGTLLRLGECREANHQLASAWSAYQDALTKATDPKKKAFATNRIKQLDPKLSHLTLKVAAAARVTGLAITRDETSVDSGLWDIAVPVNGGDYTITASAPAHVSWKTTISVPVQNGNVTVEVPALADAPVSTMPPAPAPTPVTALAPPVAHAGLSTRRKIAIGVLGGGVAAAVVGGVLGSSASSSKNDAYKQCPDPAMPCAEADQANALISVAHRRAFEADAAFAAGAAAAVAAGVLWFTGASEEHVHVEASVSAHGGGLAVVGSF